MNQFSSHPLYKRHNIDSALSSLWDFYKRKFIALFAISIVISAAVQYVSSQVNVTELSAITDPLLMLEKIKSYMVPLLIVSLISLLATTILQYYIIFNPLDSSNTVINSVFRSLKYFIPYLIIMILLAFAGTIAVILGIFVLVVGAFFAMLYVATIYLFILPVMMVEEANIGTTISRVLSLTHKNFWSNIGWVAVFIIIMLVISVIFSSVILIPFTGSFIKNIISPEDSSKIADMTTNPLFIALSAVVSALTLPLMPIFAAILYFNGRAREEEIPQVTITQPDDTKVRVEDLYAKPYSEDHPDNPENKE
jgi:hypothetical protein